MENKIISAHIPMANALATITNSPTNLREIISSIESIPCSLNFRSEH